MYEREAAERLRSLTRTFPVVTVTGPRQAGKSTLARETLPGYRYVSLEDPDARAFAVEDPRGFLSTYDGRVIIDEAQRVPQLFNYLQGWVDEAGEAGQYVLSGSQNFLLMESVTQSLAGRTAPLTLYPLSRFEQAGAGVLPDRLDDFLFEGSFPGMHRFGASPTDFFPSYIQTYLERDARSQIRAGSLDDFQRFLRLCAGRMGSILEISSLADETGVRATTAKRWISILQASHVLVLLSPYFDNFNKRLVKRPKLYFCDTGLACSLLGLRSPGDVAVSPFRGALFEGFVLMEHLKRRCAKESRPDVWFWQETATNEVDLIFGGGGSLHAVEAKSGATFNRRWFKSMGVFSKLAGVDPTRRTIVYGGSERLRTSAGEVVPWRGWDGLGS